MLGQTSNETDANIKIGTGVSCGCCFFTIVHLQRASKKVVLLVGWAWVGGHGLFG